MSRKVLYSTVVAALIGALQPAHGTTTYFYSGQQCQWYHGSESNLQYSAQGIVNQYPSGFRGAFCPANGYTNSNLVEIQTATVIYYDGSPALPLQCSVQGTNWDGTLYYSGTLFSCSTYGGCESEVDSANYTGIGQLNFTNPLQRDIYALNVFIECFIPDHSSVYGYNMTTTLP
jgi:hypothetical protein